MDTSRRAPAQPNLARRGTGLAGIVTPVLVGGDESAPISFASLRQRLLAVGCLLGVLSCAASAAAQNLGRTGIPDTRAKELKLNWKPEDDLPSSRYALAAATAPDGSIFVIGGAVGASTVNTVDVYSPHGNRWVSGPALPHPRYRHAAATGGDGRIYAIGGGDPGGVGAFLSSVVALTPGSQQWVSVAGMPTGRQLPGATTGSDGRIYVVGGHNFVGGIENVLDVLEIYDPATNQWAQGAPMPTARYDVAVATADDGRIYAIGGLAGGGLHPLDVVEAYSPATNSWAAVAPIHAPLRALADAVTGPDGRVYLCGGCELVTDADGNPVDCADSRRVDAYSPATNSWETVEPTIAVHREGAATASGTRLYAISGHTSAVESAK